MKNYLDARDQLASVPGWEHSRKKLGAGDGDSPYQARQKLPKGPWGFCHSCWDQTPPTLDLGPSSV